MVPAFDLFGCDVFLVTGFMPAFDARFHCRSCLFADPMEPPAFLSADHDFRVAAMNSDPSSEIGPCAKISWPPLCEGSGNCFRLALFHLELSKQEARTIAST